MEELQLDITRSEVAERLLSLNGQQYSLRDYPMFVNILNSPWPRRLMRSGRQVSKTTTMGADLTISVVEEPYTACLYCNSSQAQTRSFSNSKLAPFLRQSPLIYHTFFKGKSVIDNVFEKRLSNCSSIEMSYFCDVADRVRGKSARSMYLDEVQDMLWEAMIDAEECLSAAAHPKIMYAGTSKSTITPLEDLWLNSTKKEWLIPCSGCGSYNRPGRKNIGKHGLICSKCGKELNTYEGFWYSFADADKEPMVDGYWIPQIIMPIHCCSADKWKRLLEKLETYPDIKFDNEVMGLPNGEGDSPITEEMLRNMCIDTLKMSDEPIRSIQESYDGFVAGIDWGGGGVMGTSRTTLHIYAYGTSPARYTCVFGRIYDEGEPSRHVEDIARILLRYNCDAVYGDHGGGNFAMSQLRQLVSGAMQVVPVMYSEASSPLKWNESGKFFTANRTTVIDEFFADMQRNLIHAYNWEEFRPSAKDILNIRQVYIGEEIGKPRRVWRHSQQAPDDSLHSMVFGWIGCRVITGRLDFTGNAG